MKLLCCVTYKGTNYQGWQKQPDAPTIQGEIEKVLSQILNTKIDTFGSGRTDAGVHAINQYFHFETEKDVDIEKLRYSANCLLPEDIFLKEIMVVNDDFHARYNAKGKIYCYKIRFGERNPLTNDLETNVPYELDGNLLTESLKKYFGTHNFRDFTSKEEDQDGFVRTIDEVTTHFDESDDTFEIIFKGNGFMRYQIRFMVGTAIAIASHKEEIDYLDYHLSEKGNREIVSYKAEPQGLYLVDVQY